MARRSGKSAAHQPADRRSERKADLVVTNGRIYTVDARRSEAAAFAVVGDTIAYVGDASRAAEFVGGNTRVLDVRGRRVLPAFVDSHCHATSAVGELYEVMLHGLGSAEACLRSIRDFAAARRDLPGLRGGGWLNATFGPQGPSAELLDSILPDVPAVLSSQDYHSVWVNSKALSLAGITRQTPDPAGGIIERGSDGRPSGTLRESAVDLVEGVIPAYTSAQLLEGLKAFQALAHSLGMTTAYLPDLPGGGGEELAALHAFDASGEMAIRLPMAVRLDPSDDIAAVDNLAKLRDREAGGRFEIVGAKIFMDGVLEGGTAYLEEPYLHHPESRGELLWDPKRYNEMCAALDRAGLQIHVHSIGDASTRLTLDGLAFARERNGRRPNRPMITHLQLVHPADIARFAELDVIAVPQPYWFCIDANYGQAVEYVGQVRADRQYPMRSFFDAGVVVASASDYPVTRPPDPLDAIEMGITRTVPLGAQGYVEPDFEKSLPPDEGVPVRQMIESFTIHGAYAAHLEDKIGSIEVGKKADFIVLDRDILRIPPREIHAGSVILTFFEGQEVYRSDRFDEAASPDPSFA
jgi:predicted amidohydrolase YtcJ